MIKKKLDELTKTVKKQNDEQIKFRRAYEDQINNLDEDNIPKLSNVIETNTKNGQAIAAVVSSDGAGGYKADASLILQSINGQSSATLRADKVDFNAGTYTVGADHISLAGKTINMTGDNIKIASTNFNVDRTGKATMNAAVIKKGCILGSDITSGAGIQIGSTYQFDSTSGKSSDVKIYVSETEDGVGYSKGIEIRANDTGGNITDPRSGSLVVNSQEMALTTLAGEASQGISYTTNLGSSDAYIGIEKYNNATTTALVIRVGNTGIWITDGAIYTTGITSGSPPWVT
jgi:hypothetical protein